MNSGVSDPSKFCCYKTVKLIPIFKTIRTLLSSYRLELPAVFLYSSEGTELQRKFNLSHRILSHRKLLFLTTIVPNGNSHHIPVVYSLVTHNFSRAPLDFPERNHYIIENTELV